MMPLYMSHFSTCLSTQERCLTLGLKGQSSLHTKTRVTPKSPENYKPITILSCFGKLFTSILNARLNKFLDAHTILEENQAGLRAGYSTMDHIFVLHAKHLILYGELGYGRNF